MEQYTIKLHQINQSLTDTRFLKIENLYAYQFEKIGVIGNNGTGKTTLLNMITQPSLVEKGSVDVKEEIQYFKQIDTPENIEINTLDGSILSELQLPMAEIGKMSGGEKAKYKLATVISNYSPILLLDEPTNHLDYASVDYLIQTLKFYYGTLIIVSHDRDVLDEVVDTIWDIQNDGTIRVFKGNYSQYERQLELENMEQQRQYDNYINEKKRLAHASDNKRKKAQQIQTASAKHKSKSMSPDRLSGSKQKDTVEKATQKQAKHIEKRMAQLEKIEKPQAENQFQFPHSKIYDVHNHYPIVAQDLNIIKEGNNILSHARFQIPYAKNIAIIGENGSGKTSLFETIYQRDPSIDCSPKIEMAYYQQLSYQDMYDVPLLQYLIEKTGATSSFARAILNNLGLNEALDRSCVDLSGGERTKLSLAILFSTKANMLILDEPTNFLDIKIITALEQFMNKYPGIILFTSHDSNFIKNVADRKWQIKNKAVFDIT
ncbi:ABC-F type ribosomal protection protein [Staphylococcus nepalensis]|uniref:ribosomal protection-like ABC-F family protein n=1 Tax=Staphylococcus nepalensis TaxID=214473 RepID=UPI0022717899|nr:ABC-F type ribosomal protection protein [Staphylococcus nepalensis]MCY1038372.1 ABC-F type ribosomal protection protein [Staphylococcus nepalensis]